MRQGPPSLLGNQKTQVLMGLVQMKQELLRKQVDQLRQAQKKPVGQQRQALKMRDLLGLMMLGLTMQEDPHWLVPKKQVLPSLLENQMMREDPTVPRMLVLPRTQVDQQKQVPMKRGLQSLLENQMTLVLMELEQTRQEPLTMQVGQIRLVPKSLGALKKQEDQQKLVLKRPVGPQRLVLTMQELQSLREDLMESVLMKQGLKRLEQMKLEVLGQSLL
jgi:hypothetical protein